MRRLPRAMCAAFCAPSRRASEGARVSALWLWLWRLLALVAGDDIHDAVSVWQPAQPVPMKIIYLNSRLTPPTQAGWGSAGCCVLRSALLRGSAHQLTRSLPTLQRSCRAATGVHRRGVPAGAAAQHARTRHPTSLRTTLPPAAAGARRAACQCGMHAAHTCSASQLCQSVLRKYADARFALRCGRPAQRSRHMRHHPRWPAFINPLRAAAPRPRRSPPARHFLHPHACPLARTSVCRSRRLLSRAARLAPRAWLRLRLQKLPRKCSRARPRRCRRSRCGDTNGALRASRRRSSLTPQSGKSCLARAFARAALSGNSSCIQTAKTMRV
jgi:hypothetical protein